MNQFEAAISVLKNRLANRGPGSERNELEQGIRVLEDWPKWQPLIEAAGREDGIIYHAWKDGKWLGVVAGQGLSDRVFIGHIQSHLKAGQEVVCKICGRTAREICSLPEPEDERK